MKKVRIQRVGLLALFLVISGLALTGKASSQASVYGDFSAAQIGDLQGKNFFYGATGGFVDNFGSRHRLAFSGDLQASYLRGAGQTFTGLLLGPRLAFVAGKFSPSVEGLVGFGRYNAGPGTPSSASTDALVQGGFALDRQIAKRLDWRVVQASYAQFFDTGNRFHPYNFSTGIVVHLAAR
jgi:hypothetical protein